MKLGRILASGVLVAVLCGGMALGQTQTTPPIQQTADASVPALPLPRDKHGAAIEGACDVSLVVDEAGRPQKIHVVHCTNKQLKDYAVFTVAGYKFIPAKQNGHPVSAQTMIEVSAHEPAKDAVEHVVDPTVRVHVADPPPLRAQTGSDNDPMNIGKDITPPVAIYTPEAEYSNAARRRWENCTVGINIIVTKEGKVGDELLTDSCPDLDANALQAVQMYRFKPAMKDGQPVAVRIQIEVGFTITRK